MIRFFDAWEKEIVAEEKVREFYPVEKYLVSENGKTTQNATNYNEAEAVEFASSRANGSVISERLKAYGKIGDQLDEIYHNFDGWKDRIKKIKETYPKNTQGE